MAWAVQARVGLVCGARADLQDYYENEARMRLRRPLRGRRVELRDEFLGLLDREGRASVVDFGAGPGRDGAAFQAAGHHFVGIDLAHGNGRLAAEADLVVIQGSITAVPIKPSSFDAGWSLSTLMHLDEAEAALALDEIVGVLQPGAPLLVGVWGRETAASIVNDTDISGSRRPFHLRSFDRNRQLLTARGDLEQAERWEEASEDWDYQVFRLRTAG